MSTYGSTGRLGVAQAEETNNRQRAASIRSAHVPTRASSSERLIITFTNKLLCASCITVPFYTIAHTALLDMHTQLHMTTFHSFSQLMALVDAVAGMNGNNVYVFTGVTARSRHIEC
jgi:hypothetical protein